MAFQVTVFLVALIAGLQGTARAFIGWRCLAMEQRLAEPCCPGEDHPGTHDDGAARISPRCCERLDAPDLPRLRTDERDATRLPTPHDIVASPLLPALVTGAPPHSLFAARYAWVAWPPGERLHRLSTVLRL